jgi:dTDP-4-amino-4,6-dideoxygalactose transaminase
MKIPFVDLKAQYNDLKEKIDKAIFKVVNECSFIQGSDVFAFEEEFAQFIGAKYAMSVGNGTDAIELALIGLGVNRGDEIITVPNTYIATCEGIAAAGAKPVFVDIDPKTYNIDPSKLESKINNKTEGIIAVHLYGQPAPMDEILQIANDHGLFVLEDSCQAHGATYKSQNAGSIGDAAAFSFYPSMNLGCYGDGGMITTNNVKVAHRIKLLKDHGQKKKNVHDIVGYNSRLDTIQSAILRVKLNYLESWNEKRRAAALIYDELLRKIDIEPPFVSPDVTHVYHLYVIQIEKRDELVEFLEKNGVSCGIHYPYPIHTQKAFRFMRKYKGRYPVTEEVVSKIISLPMFPEITEEQIRYTVDLIEKFKTKTKSRY